MAQKLRKQDMYYLIDRQFDANEVVVVLAHGEKWLMEERMHELLELERDAIRDMMKAGSSDLKFFDRFRLRLEVWPDQLNLFTHNTVE